MKQRYVFAAIAFGILVPLAPFVAWMLGGVALSPTGFGLFLAVGTTYLGVIAVGAVVCCVRELSRFFAGMDLSQHASLRNLLVPTLGKLPPDPSISPLRQGDEG